MLFSSVYVPVLFWAIFVWILARDADVVFS
jgi:hypothetical protein